MSTIKRSKTDAFSVKESVNIVKLAEAAFEQISLDQLTDVVVETPTDGDILVYSSDLMAWENVPQAGLNYDLEDLDNITITSVSDGQVLTWDPGTSKWVNETPTTGATTLDGLSDVNTLGVADGMVLMYNSDTSEWNAESLDYPQDLDDLSDVAITTPAEGEYLRYVGGEWVNDNLPNTLIEIGVACSDETTALTTGTAKVTFRVPTAITLTGVRASLTTAQTSGSTFTVDINASGTSILSTKLTIDNTEKTSVSAATQPVISAPALDDDEEITVDIDQVGDGTAKGLRIWLIGTRQ